MCNPDWFNLIKGCSFELDDRKIKLIEIDRPEDNFYLFTGLKEVHYELELKYIDKVVRRTRDLA